MKKIINICSIVCVLMLQVVSCTPEETPANVDRPVITIENKGQIAVSFEGGEISVAYSVDKPVEGGHVTLQLDENNTWIDYVITDSHIVFVIEESCEDVVRNEMMTVKYSYGTESVKEYITITQYPSEYMKIYDANFGGCIWYDNFYSLDKTLTKYVVMLETEDGIVISLDLSAPEDTEDMLPPAGEYTSYEYRLEKGYAISVGPYAGTYICQYYSENDFKYIAIGGLDSKVEVSREGDVYTIKAHIVDDVKGDEYLVRYTGTMEVDNGLVSSTLTSDIDKTYDAAELGLVAQSANYEFGPSARYWVIYILSNQMEVGQPVIYLELLSEIDAVTPDMLVGSYIEDADYEINKTAGIFVPGLADYTGTWYSEISNIVDGKAYAEIETPIVDGTVEFIGNDDGTLNIIINGMDDNDKTPHNVRVVLENVSFL